MLFEFKKTPFYALAATLRLLWAKLRGFEVLATETDAEDRLNVCYDCPLLTHHGQCRICTCYVEAKVLLNTEECPMKRWRRIWRKSNRKTA